MAYFDNINPDLLAAIPLNVNSVLELGCGTGALGYAYKLRNSDAHYVGIEITEEAGKQAGAILDEVIVGDIERDAVIEELKRLADGKGFEAIVFGDVLEHLRDPWSVLKKLHALASENAVVIACIPNVGHWTLLTQQLHGRWEYSDAGLLDRSHLRFFTLNSALAMFKETGWSGIDAKPRVLWPEKTQAAVSVFGKLSKDLAINPDVMAQNLSAFQWVMRAGKGPDKKILHIAAIGLKKTAGVTDARVDYPLGTLRSLPFTKVIWSAGGLKVPPGFDPGILILHRQFVDKATLDKQAAKGWVIVSDMDDDPRHWEKFTQSNFIEYRGAHAVTVSTEPLAELMKQWNPHVKVFQNAIMTLPNVSKTTPKKGNKLRVFFGALNRDKDWSEVKAGIDGALLAMKGKITCVVVHDRKFHDALPGGVDKEFHPTLPHDKYLEILGTCDVGLLPLADNAFNRMKSDLKFIECCAAEVVPICSRVVYDERAEHREIGLFATTAEDWQSAITTLCQKPEEIAKRKKIGLDYVKRKRMHCHQAAEREAYYRELQANRQELERQRQRRLALLQAPDGPTLDDQNKLIDLFNRNRIAEMEQEARVLTEAYPKHAMGWKVLGVALRQQSRTAEAVVPLEKATQLEPADAEGHNNLGVVYKSLGRLGDAENCYREAIARNDKYAEAYNNLGVILLKQGRLTEAEACCRRAIELKPDFIEAYSNLAKVLHDQGLLEEAEDLNQQAILRNPNYAEAYNNQGNVLLCQNRFGEAETSYRRAIELRPAHSKSYSNLACLLKDRGRFKEALAYFRHAIELDTSYLSAYDNLLFCMNLLDDVTPEAMLREAVVYGERVERPEKKYTSWNGIREASRNLRIGWVSGDLRDHPVGYFLVSVLHELKNSPEFEHVAYYNHYQYDETTSKLKACCARWRQAMGLGDEQLAQQIHDDGIDILIDLAGHTAHNRLPVFAWKPAPVQASWLGYFATTGVREIDYLIADPWTLPLAEEGHFTETVWRLPETRLCFTPPETDVPVAPLPAAANGHVTFGCFNNLAKVNDAVVALWARILVALPGSRLMLKTKQLADASVRQATLDRFARHGVDPGRLLLEGPTPRADYLAAYARVDIALDPFPYPGGTTSVEGLWMGVPVLTLAGGRFLARQGVGILMNAGLPDWIAADPDDYVRRALRHAGDLAALARLRRELRQRLPATPLVDAGRFAGHFAAALRGMWRERCDNWPS